MKICNEEGCTYPVFSHLKCKSHQYKRTDKPNEGNKKPNKPRSTIKRYKVSTLETEGLKSTIGKQWGFNNQKELFEFVWSTRPHLCLFTGSNLDLVSKDRIHWTMMHILRKGTYTYWKLNPENIVLGHPDFHVSADNFTEDERTKHPSWDFDLFLRLQDEQKEKYKLFLKENQL